MTRYSPNASMQIQAANEAVQEIAEIIVWAADNVAQGVHC